MRRRFSSKRYGDKGNKPSTEAALVAWTVYYSWNSLGSQESDKVEVTKAGDGYSIGL